VFAYPKATIYLNLSGPLVLVLRSRTKKAAGNRNPAEEVLHDPEILASLR